MTDEELDKLADELSPVMSSFALIPTARRVAISEALRRVRERCAQECEERADNLPRHFVHEVAELRACAAKIRGKS